nr:MAG TPA: hypothetical protein [Caudoviricetes sp.]
MLHSQLQTGPDQSMRQGRCVPKQRRGKGARPMCSTKADDTGKGSRAGRGNCVPR